MLISRVYSPVLFARYQTFNLQKLGAFRKGKLTNLQFGGLRTVTERPDFDRFCGILPWSPADFRGGEFRVSYYTTDTRIRNLVIDQFGNVEELRYRLVD